MELLPDTPIWVWVVRLGKGKWWPGTVLSINVHDGSAHLTVRFECRTSEKRRLHSIAFVGVTTTRMRFLEVRDTNLKEIDRPHGAPASLLRTPETSLRNLAPVEHPSAAPQRTSRSAKQV
ncbi:MAG TPA: hypothetical protein VMV19_17395 [Xanthobacteraceae bacterium]|nr:hypothetical protein [Xanthobacteraceae bacterium]